MSKKRKKKKSAPAAFLRGFGMSLLLIGMLFLTGFASYRVSLFYFQERGISTTSKASAVIRELYGSASVEEISKNLIYSVNPKNGKIKALVLEVFNTNTGNMDYITIPANTEVTISNELYQKLSRAGCEAPQIIKLSAIHKYFSEDTMYEYGELILNDLLGIDISYYTVVEPAVFKQWFEKTERQEAVQTEALATVQTVELWTMTENFKNELLAVEKEEAAVKTYLEKLYESCSSNLSLRSRKKYAADYLKWELANTYFHMLPGVAEEDSYTALPEEAKALLEQILGNSAYTEPQSLDSSATGTADSRACVLQILNASQINGLAARYKESLEAQGYQVDSIGNYAGQMQEESQILVREEGMGTDLLLYLEGGRLTVSDALPEGIDIQIILGTAANK